jgi:hypothetical protein
MATPRTIASIKYNEKRKDWNVHVANGQIHNFQTLIDALKYADVLFTQEGDAITVHHPDKRIELLFAPMDLFAAVLRNI